MIIRILSPAMKSSTALRPTRARLAKQSINSSRAISAASYARCTISIRNRFATPVCPRMKSGSSIQNEPYEWWNWHDEY